MTQVPEGIETTTGEGIDLAQLFKMCTELSA